MREAEERGESAIEDPDLADGEVLTVAEAAKFLRVGINQLYDAIGRLEVPHRRIGKSIRLSRSALVRWLAGEQEC